MLKIIIIVFVFVSELSLYGNFSLINHNLVLQEQMSELNLKNIKLSNQVSSLTSKISSLEATLSEPDKTIFPEPKFQNIDNFNTQSIKAVAVKPILVKSGFF